MNNNQAFWQAYVDQMAATLRLRDWTIEVSDQAPSDPEYLASITPVFGRQVAVVNLSRRFFDDLPEDQRQTILHELLHLHTNRAKNVFLLITNNRSEGWLKLGEDFHNEAIELTTDIIADIIAPFLPLPSEKRRKTLKAPS